MLLSASLVILRRRTQRKTVLEPLTSVCLCVCVLSIKLPPYGEMEINKLLSYRRETTLQGGLVMARSGKLELGDNILQTFFNHLKVIGRKAIKFCEKMQHKGY